MRNERGPGGRRRRAIDVSAEMPIVADRSLCQAVFAIQWLWSFRRLWVAVTSLHSDCVGCPASSHEPVDVPVVFDLSELRVAEQR